MLRAALVMLAAFAALHLFGARPSVSVLSGTIHSWPQAFLGLAYAAAYFAAVLLAPPLLAAGLFGVIARRRRAATSRSGDAAAAAPARRGAA